jgi:polysaccharide export outer membrane protein
MAKTARLVVVLLLVAAAGAEANPQGSYRIAAGDLLEVIVWRNKELSMPVTVRPDGWISYPLVSDLQAAGLTPVELQHKLENAFASVVTTPMVTVLVSRVANVRVSILGKVRQPGRYAIDGPTTALDVLALAGGPTEYADPEGIYILRRSADPAALYERIPARYSSSISPGKGNTNVAVSAGDIIIVP